MEQIKSLEELANYFYGLSDCSVEPFDRLYGICHQVDCLFEEGMLSEYIEINFPSLEKFFYSWSNFSGRVVYPVPSTDSNYPAAVNMFDSVLSRNGDMWTGAYGDLRKDLCRHIAKEIEVLIEVN